LPTSNDHTAASEQVSYDVAGYDAFRARARDDALSANQRAGFPDSYRAGRSDDILRDIAGKLRAFERPGAVLLDIGCGCSELTHALIDAAGARNQRLTLVDSAEMLEQLPSPGHVTKVVGRFPDCGGAIEPALGAAGFDAVLAYSVAQYVFLEANLVAFVDAATSLLSGTGAFLLGDLPNASMRNRFFASPSGRRHHAIHYPGRPEPTATFNAPQPGQIDDAVVFGLIARARAAGFHAFVLPQAPELPMANRREDILIRRP